MSWIRQKGQAYCSWLCNLQQKPAKRRRWRHPAGYLLPRVTLPTVVARIVASNYLTCPYTFCRPLFLVGGCVRAAYWRSVSFLFIR